MVPLPDFLMFKVFQRVESGYFDPIPHIPMDETKYIYLLYI